MVPSFLVRDRDFMIVTHVRSHWKNTSLSTPALWDTMTALHSPDQAAAHFERSEDIPFNLSIAASGLESAGWSSSFRMSGQHSHRFGATNLHHHAREDVFAIMENPFPRLAKLELEILDGE